jgi:hypothetical protein
MREYILASLYSSSMEMGRYDRETAIRVMRAALDFDGIGLPNHSLQPTSAFGSAAQPQIVGQHHHRSSPFDVQFLTTVNPRPAAQRLFTSSAAEVVQ